MESWCQLRIGMDSNDRVSRLVMPLIEAALIAMVCCGRSTVQQLAASTGCPTIDAERATYTDIVLRSDEDELLVLRYSSYFRLWYACGCMSVDAASNGVIRGADLYWQGTGYLENATFGYAIFDQKPLIQSHRWNAFYDRVSETESIRALREDSVETKKQLP